MKEDFSQLRERRSPQPSNYTFRISAKTFLQALLASLFSKCDEAEYVVP
jgi:hypothetical protein